MKTTHIISLLLLALLWVGLCVTLATRAGLTPYNVFVMIASGIIIFVPLWKKYVRQTQDKRK